jgi:hypothetical protein
MTQAESQVPSSDSGSRKSGPRLEDERVVAAMHEYLAALERGRKPDRADFFQRHAAIATELADCLEGLEFVHLIGPHLSHPRGSGSAGSTPSGEELEPEMPLGDYRIIREVGRGGMGVVL